MGTYKGSDLVCENPTKDLKNNTCRSESHKKVCKSTSFENGDHRGLHLGQRSHEVLALASITSA